MAIPTPPYKETFTWVDPYGKQVALDQVVIKPPRFVSSAGGTTMTYPGYKSVLPGRMLCEGEIHFNPGTYEFSAFPHGSLRVDMPDGSYIDSGPLVVKEVNVAHPNRGGSISNHDWDCFKLLYTDPIGQTLLIGTATFIFESEQQGNKSAKVADLGTFMEFMSRYDGCQLSVQEIGMNVNIEIVVRKDGDLYRAGISIAQREIAVARHSNNHQALLTEHLAELIEKVEQEVFTGRVYKAKAGPTGVYGAPAASAYYPTAAVSISKLSASSVAAILNKVINEKLGPQEPPKKKWRHDEEPF